MDLNPAELDDRPYPQWWVGLVAIVALTVTCSLLAMIV